MATIPGNDLSPAADAGVGHLSTNPGVVAYLEQLHSMVLVVYPNCLVKQRGDGALIYVPSERREATQGKNLLTMWAERAGVRMRIMPDPEEMYDPADRVTYLSRLQQLRDKLLALVDSGF